LGGIFGVVSQKNCVEDLYKGTFYLQHRAQKYSGLAISDGEKIYPDTHRGYLKENFPKSLRDQFKGDAGVGAVASDRQPVSELSRSGGLVTGFDGNIINHPDLKNELLKGRITFSGHHNPEDVSDTSIISKIVSREVNFEKGIEALVEIMRGDFAVISLAKEGIYAARGWGRKPLILGQKEGSYAVASESNAFVNTKFQIYRDVEPGEIVLLNHEGIHTIKKLNLSPIKYGTFEWIYTAYPASVIDGRSVSEVRKAIGRLLAKRYPVEADIVSPYPNSGRWHAIGYAQESGIPYEEAFIRYDYSDRSFTQEDQASQYGEAEEKLIIVSSSVKGKRIVMVDDSIVRGTQTLSKTKELRENGAKEIHERIACMALMRACLYGKTTKKDEDCIARRMPVEEIRQLLNVNSLGYATVEDLEAAIGLSKDKLCLECWGY